MRSMVVGSAPTVGDWRHPSFGLNRPRYPSDPAPPGHLPMNGSERTDNDASQSAKVFPSLQSLPKQTSGQDRSAPQHLPNPA